MKGTGITVNAEFCHNTDNFHPCLPRIMIIKSIVDHIIILCTSQCESPGATHGVLTAFWLSIQGIITILF